jgi:hypothetical protein
MKTAIFTLPLINNYGGILQAYALQNVLFELGIDNKVLNLRTKEASFFSINYAKFLIAKTFISRYKNAKFEILRHDLDARNFIEKNIVLTDEIYGFSDLKRVCKDEKFDAFVLGSDQVFNQGNFMNFGEYFSLGFIQNAVKIAYAASFGGEFKGWKNLSTHRENLAKFSAISVREQNAIKICKEILNLKADFVLDPTLLARREIYDKFCTNLDESSSQNTKIFAYILDPNEKTTQILDNASQKSRCKIAQVNDRANRLKIEEWLSAIKSAKFIITDSFHGCVFSIIFGKPFFAIINEARGNARFHSLFNMLNLDNRVIKDVNFELNLAMNYDEIYKILDEKRKFSIDFLKQNLKV